MALVLMFANVLMPPGKHLVAFILKHKHLGVFSAVLIKKHSHPKLVHPHNARASPFNTVNAANSKPHACQCEGIDKRERVRERERERQKGRERKGERENERDNDIEKE